MITDEHKGRVLAGTLPQGNVRGTIERYDIAPDEDYVSDTLALTVTESDVDGIAPGQSITVAFAHPKEGNLLVRDLQNGFGGGGLEPVPVGGEVTFSHCERTAEGEIDAAAYEIDTISRPEAPGPR